MRQESIIRDIERALTAIARSLGHRDLGRQVERRLGFFIGRETLVPSEHPKLGRWTTCIYPKLAASALSPARFFRLPPNRVVELGNQIET
jgi:KUP system potassium uptake protein